MEIKLDLGKVGKNTKFKIDLIVWKSDCFPYGNINNYTFKIDLIVWKLLLG